MRKLIICCLAFYHFTQLYAQDQRIEHIYETDDVEAFQQSNVADRISLDALWTAFDSGAFRISRHIMEEMSDISGFHQSGLSILHKAVLVASPDVKYILKRGLAVDLKTKNDGLGGTPLMFACARKNPEMISLLLDAGADPNAIDDNLDPVLNWAAFYGNAAAMKLLIDAGADVNIKSKHGDAADVILRLWHSDSLLELFRETDIANKIPESDVMFHEKIDKGNISSSYIQTLDSNIINRPDPYGNYAIHKLASSGDTIMLKQILQHGAQIDQLNRVGQSAIAWAARWGNRAAVDLLLEWGANPNQTDTIYRLSPMIGAAVGGQVEIAEELLKHSALLNATDKINEAAPLHWANWYGHNDLVLFLLEQGADYTKSILNGSSHLKASVSDTTVLKKLEHYDALKSSMTHSWRCDQIKYIYNDTTYIIDDPAMGMVTFSPSRYVIMYHPTSRVRPAFKDFTAPTDQELRQAFENLVFNTGSYHMTDHMLICHPDIARVPGFEGAEQKYYYLMENDQMTLTLFDEVYPNKKRPRWIGKLKVELSFIKE